MKTDGRCTYWGKLLTDSIDNKIQKLLGVDKELYTPGDNYDKTKERKEAVAIVEDPEVRGLNARQLLLKCKQAHGSGRNLDFPSQQHIAEAMHGFEDDVMIKVYGDGSLTNPTKWWAALGGLWCLDPSLEQAGGSTTRERRGLLLWPCDWTNWHIYQDGAHRLG